MPTPLMVAQGGRVLRVGGMVAHGGGVFSNDEPSRFISYIIYIVLIDTLLITVMDDIKGSQILLV